MANSPVSPDEAKAAAATAIEADAKKVVLTKQSDGKYVVEVTN